MFNVSFNRLRRESKHAVLNGLVAPNAMAMQPAKAVSPFADNRRP